MLSEDPLTKDTRFTVESAGGVVELTGYVDSTAAKSRAGIIAASAPGVIQVRNDLLVSPGAGK